jgi:hypothetical protein
VTTSGTSTFNPAVTFLITSAYRKLNVINEMEQPTAAQFQDAMFALNSMVKEWMATGIHVWTEQEAIVFLQPGQAKYLIGPGTTDNIAPANAWVLAQVNQTATAGASSVDLVTALGITNGQNIGIVLDAGPTFWTTVDGTPSGNTVNLTSPLPSQSSAGESVFAYTTGIVRPLLVPSSRRLFYSGLNENPMRRYSRKEYMDLPNKNNPGVPTGFFYSPQLNQGEFYVWPVSQNSAAAARITWYRPIDDFNTPANTSDFPQEWLNTLIWNLAKEMGLDYSVAPARWQIILTMAAQKLDMATSWDRESEDVLFGMGFDESQP